MNVVTIQGSIASRANHGGTVNTIGVVQTIHPRANACVTENTSKSMLTNKNKKNQL